MHSTDVCGQLFFFFFLSSSGKNPRLLYLTLNQVDLTKHNTSLSVQMFVHHTNIMYLVADIFLMRIHFEKH